MKQRTVAFEKRRKFLLILPLLVLPFLTLGFWAIGGGKAAAEPQKTVEGLNSKLPGAHLAEGNLDKMSLYQKAAKDSMSQRQLLAMDPFKASSVATDSFPLDTASPTVNLSMGTGLSTSSWASGADPNEQKVRVRLQKLEDIINQPQVPDPALGSRPPATQGSEDIDRLEQMMKTVTAPPENDAQMQQLSSMLEQILDIQTPGRAQQKLREQSEKNRGQVFVVSKREKQTTADYLSNGAPPYNAVQQPDSGAIPVYTPISERNGFYDLTGDGPGSGSEQTAIPAVVHGTQTLVSGSTIKMRLLEDLMVNGTLIPKGSFVYGNCSINGERLKIEIPGLRYGKSLYPVSLSVYALDGLEGIPIPGAINRDAAKEGADRTVQSLQFMSLDPSLATQAAGAGVEVAKGLFGKKVKLVRVTVKADYPILLMDAKTQQQLH